MSEDEEKTRIDKWLWAARFFKTRSLAADAVDGGKVHLDGARVKPAKMLKVGDVLEIRQGPFEYVVTVRGLSGRRGPATEAARLYEESESSRLVREALTAQLKAQPAPQFEQKGRPTKKARRQIIRFSRGNDQ